MVEQVQTSCFHLSSLFVVRNLT
uniref:Uncharacterized protein n=1 Tax=Arundo donax TaxID=35708 RepID=A0A0A9BUS9_ARUDO